MQRQLRVLHVVEQGRHHLKDERSVLLAGRPDNRMEVRIIGVLQVRLDQLLQLLFGEVYVAVGVTPGDFLPQIRLPLVLRHDKAALQVVERGFGAEVLRQVRNVRREG